MTEPRTELECAAMIAAGLLPSPTNYFGSELFAVRISGTGAAWRSKHAEFCWRDPAIWLTEEMTDRWRGAPLVTGHPQDGLLDGDELARRIIGTILCAYPRGDELWGIARIINQDAAAILADEANYDSSPAILFAPGSGNKTITLHDGEKLLVESNPSLIDHLAVCEKGVWTRPGDVPGVEVTDQTKELENVG
jgi:hypothetical protein